MRFTHHPRHGEPFEFDPERSYVQDLSDKPQGLWLAVDDDWRRWCEEAGMDWIGNEATEFHVDLREMLVISTPEQLLEFTKGHVPDVLNTIDHFRIDWTAIADQYAGIVIAPYQWWARYSRYTCWYYGWDCASACVWDLSAVRAVVLREEFDAD